MTSRLKTLLGSPISIEREARVRALFRELELSETHISVLKQYNCSQPYHNYQHAFVVVLKSHAAALMDNATREQQRLLALAALYHDHKHSGSAHVADVVNISRAILGCQEWLGLKETWMTRAEKNTVANMIAATESSHTHRVQHAYEGVLMDADCLATDEPDFDLWLALLGEESEYPVTRATTQDFIRGAEYHSLWGSAAHTAYLERLNG